LRSLYPGIITIIGKSVIRFPCIVLLVLALHIANIGNVSHLENLLASQGAINDLRDTCPFPLTNEQAGVAPVSPVSDGITDPGYNPRGRVIRSIRS
jgi:hypothetical protein